VPGVVVGAAGSTTNRVSATFSAVCHAVAYNLYRSPAGANAWSLVASRASGENDPTDDGSAAIELTLTDAVTTGTAGAPPAANAATLAPYAQNPNFLAGVRAAGITHDASDASKAYPSTPTVLTSPPVPAGATFFDGGVQAVPRYPSNVYYNASRQSQQLDEYNWIYVLPPAGACVPVENVTTCRTTPATWAEYVASENRVMFRHVVDNDPRPHYIHQSNLADYSAGLPETHPAQGGIAYPVFGGLLARYESSFQRASAPLVQLTHTQIGQTLAQQSAWAANRTVTAWLADGRVHVKNTGTAAADVPLTGTTAGASYGGQRSGWITLAPGAEQVLPASDPAGTVREAPTSADQNGSPSIPGPGTGTAGGRTPAARPARLKLTKVKMAPRRFAVSHKRPPKGTRLDGTRVTFKVNRAAKVRLSVQRRTSGRHPRWVAVGTVTRTVKAGNGEVRLTGRFGKRLLRPRAYRLGVTAARTGQPRTAAKRISFRVVKG
jgi:hypothetical protein